MKDGTFWISDKYGPHIVHYDADGRQIERISPFGMDTGKRHLPAVLARRRANRGMEGLAANPDGKILVGIMQFTLFNPSEKEISNKQLVRIVNFDIKTGSTRQYAYIQNKETDSTCGITALSNTEFVVIERDGKFSGEKDAHKYLFMKASSLKQPSLRSGLLGDFESPHPFSSSSSFFFFLILFLLQKPSAKMKACMQYCTAFKKSTTLKQSR